MRKSIFIIIILIFSTNILLADDEGLNNYKNKKFEEAKSYYEQVLRTKENNATARLGLGASQYQLGDIPNAAKSFKEALQSKNTDVQDRAYYNLGNSLYSQQKMEESIAYYRKALELNPDDDDAKFNYELAKYIAQQQEQNQDNQDEQQDEQDQQQNDSKNDNDQENNPQDTDKDEPDKQEDEESDSSQDEQRDAPKTQKLMNTEAILDALKDEEKIHQKVKMAQQSSRKFEKDW